MFCTLLRALLAVAVHNELLVFCKSHGRFLFFICAVPPLRVFVAADLSFCITLLDVPSPCPASPAMLHAMQLRQSSDVSLACTLPSAITGTRFFFWQSGQPLLVLYSPVLLVKKCLFMLPVKTLFSCFDDGGKPPLPYSMMTLLSLSTLFRIAWKCEPTVFLFVIQI